MKANDYIIIKGNFEQLERIEIYLSKKKTNKNLLLVKVNPSISKI